MIDDGACYIDDNDHDPDDDGGDDDDDDPDDDDDGDHDNPDRPAGFCVQHNETLQVEEGKPM